MRDRQFRLSAEGPAPPAPDRILSCGYRLDAGLGKVWDSDAGRGGKQSKRSATSDAAHRGKAPLGFVGFIGLRHGVPTTGHWNKQVARAPV